MSLRRASSSPQVNGLPRPGSSSNAASKKEDDDFVYPGHLRFTVVFATLCLSVFQLSLDEVIVATAVPTITDEFKSLDDIGWYGSAYLFTDCAFQLLFGKLYTMFSVKLVYIIALAMFEFGSIVCATAPNSIGFIFGRVIAGLGAGGILSGVMTIMANSVPRSKLAHWNGILGAVSGVSFLCGPLIGGGIIARTTWRWIFWMNPILSAPTFVAVVFLIQLKSPKKSNWKDNLRMLDLPSFAIFLGSIVCLLLALQWGGTEYHWANVRIIVLFILFAILLGIFSAMQIRSNDSGLIPLNIIMHRSMAFGMIYSFCTSGGGFVLEYYLPIWLQVIKNMSTIRSAVILLPVIGSAIVCNIIGGILVPVVGYYVPFMIFASICMSVGMGILTLLRYDSTVPLVLGLQVPVGVGIGVALQQTLLAAQIILPINDVPIGISLITLAQTLGGTIALSAANTIFSSTLSAKISASVPQLNQSSILKSGAKDLRNLVPQQYLDTVLSIYSDSIVKAWYLTIALGAFSVVGCAGMEWIHVNPAPVTKGDGAEEVSAVFKGKGTIGDS